MLSRKRGREMNIRVNVHTYDNGRCDWGADCIDAKGNRRMGLVQHGWSLTKEAAEKDIHEVFKEFLLPHYIPDISYTEGDVCEPISTTKDQP